ncbi:MAG: 50S ribosomal protein L29, partial [Candidatus Paceibacterota bacterium]
IMDIGELEEKSVEELKKLEADRREKLRSLRFDLSSGKAKNVDEVRKIKKDIAQIKTVINQKT